MYSANLILNQKKKFETVSSTVLSFITHLLHFIHQLNKTYIMRLYAIKSTTRKTGYNNKETPFNKT